MAEPKEETI